jgi:NAD+ synthase (glutamine-hydrolysing)
MKATEATLAGEFAGRAPDAAEENIQSRCRMLLLMGISNKTGKMLLTTGNKSEMAVGYATLYGDMAGGFAPIKDCSKLLVYRLAEYRQRVARDSAARDRAAAVGGHRRTRRTATAAAVRSAGSDPQAFIEDDLSVDEICARG